MKLSEHLPLYVELVTEFMQEFGERPEDILSGRDAWTVAFRAGVTRHAYALSRNVHDGHIQTALERIFVNAKFLEKKRY